MIAEAGHLLGVSTSLSGRYWTLKDADEGAVRALARQSGLADVIARLLVLRGVAPGEADGYLAPTLRETFPDPSSFRDMDKAAEIVLDAILEGRNVVVFADYDVDGGTSSAILTRYFRAWGRELGLYVPNRLSEGYGPSPEAFRRIKAEGADLVVTVDCGAAARSALEEAEAIDLPVVVLDHHLMAGDLPPCAALINPNRADDRSGCGHLAAAGVVFVFVAALNRLARARNVAPEAGLPDIMAWLDLCALGTLCDMSPLEGVNRAFVRHGLKRLQAGINTGLRALGDVAGLGAIKSVYHATFVLGPRLNAGGRVGDQWLAAKLLASDDRAEAIAMAEELHALNEERKAIEAAILEAAKLQAENALKRDPGRSVIIAGGEGWHPGVIGIVAGRLKEQFHLPAIVIGWGEGLGPVAKGSARSITGVNIGDAIGAAAKEGVILSGGGHAMAGGLSLEPGQLADFDAWMNAHLAEFTEEREAAKGLSLDGLISASSADTAFCDQLSALEPYGQGAPEPVFAFERLRITAPRRIGTNHLRFSAENAEGRIECIAWRAGDTPLADAVFSGEILHLAGRLKADEWNGRRRVQLEVIDAARAQ